jgi:hypothetical protein
MGLEQKAAANHQAIAITRQRLTAGEDVPRMYQEPGQAGLERQGEVAEALVAERQAGSQAPPVMSCRPPDGRFRVERQVR